MFVQSLKQKLNLNRMKIDVESSDKCVFGAENDTSFLNRSKKFNINEVNGSISY